MNKNKLQSHSNAGRVRSLGLVNMALPLTVATPPQLRHRRHFQFNGMRFEANPLSLQSPRSTLDGDAGDARYSTSSEQRRDSPCFPFKSSASHLHSLRGGDNISVTKTQQHGGGYNTQMHQSSVRMPWRAVNDTDYDNDMAGGEDVYSGGSSIDHMHHAQSRYSRFPPDDEYNSNNYNNNNKNGNNNVNNNYINSRYNNNNTSCNDNCIENDDNNIQIDNNTQEQRPILTGIDLQRPSKLSEFQSIQMRASDGTKPAAAVTHSKMDYITLVGFLLGYLASNVLFFLCWYFSWLKGQVMKLRKHFLGQSNLWEFFDFEDTTRYSMQTKLILAPLILICSILYCVVNILHLMIKLVRSDVPRTVVDLVQRIAKNYWP